MVDMLGFLRSSLEKEFIFKHALLHITKKEKDAAERTKVVSPQTPICASSHLPFPRII
jgi:hypothetical protein